MKLNPNNLNIRYGRAISKSGHAINSDPNFSSPSFTGLKEKACDAAVDTIKTAGAKVKDEVADGVKDTFTKKIKPHAGELLSGAKDKSVKFIKENITEGTDVTYKNSKEIIQGLKKNFGDTFDDCFLDIDNYNNTINSHKNDRVSEFFHKKFKVQRGKRDKFIYINNENDDLITFHKDPLLKELCRNVKEFTVGTVLDIGVSARNGIRKLNSKLGRSDVVSSTNKKSSFINRVLDNRISETRARDSFYKISGVFQQASKGLDEISASRITANEDMARAQIEQAIDKNISGLAKESIGKASRKVGKYNTKTERAWNRLGTGFVSACFASTDFYNISMLQNDDTKQANESGRKRFAQDMRRQCLTAGITYVVLGALQSKVNKSIAYAALSLGGVTLISEVLSRLMGGIPLTPLSPEDAKKEAEKKKNKDEKKKTDESQKQEENNQGQTGTQQTLPAVDNSYDVFKIFTDKINTTSQSKNPAFTSNLNAGSPDENKGEKKKSSLPSKILAGVLGAVGLSLGIGFLRSRNVFKIDDIIKSISCKYNDMTTKLTRKRLILPKDDVDGFLSYLNKNNFNQQHNELTKALSSVRKGRAMTGQANTVQKYLPKKEINPTGLYYDFGWVESKGKKAAVNLFLYPINTVSKLVQKGNNIIKGLFTSKPKKDEANELSEKVAVSFIEKYSSKYKDALNKNDMYPFKKEMEDAFTRHFSEANSQNKNTSIAMISRFLITFISGYFFVNDYRNEVLIESKGQDVDRANATMRERIGHKVANFFLNSMFMDLFNTTFENIYLSSVVGATAVAMATEVTNESAVRASICTPTKKMSRDELIEYENERLGDQSLKGDYYRMFMKLTGKKPLSEKAKK